jgi:hypothetical protein
MFFGKKFTKNLTNEARRKSEGFIFFTIRFLPLLLARRREL